MVLTGRLSTVERAPGMAFGAFAYDEFGVPLSGNGSPTGFTGYIHDDIADTYFAQAREYMPEIGRFAGRDILKGQIEIPKSLNEYSYCHNDPVGFVDFNGMKEKRGSQDPAEFNIDYVRNQASGKVIEKAEIHLNYKIREYSVFNKYSREYDVTKKQLINERIRTGNPRAGTGRLSWQTRRRNVKLGELQYERDVARGKIRELSLNNLKKSAARGGIIGGAVDVGFGLYEDYNGGLSGSKMASNTAVNFAFGAAEGAIIGVATAAFGPAGFIISSLLIGIIEYKYSIRQTAKDAINSLD